MRNKKHSFIGTCSWKYDSWQGLIYPERKPFNYLKEYSRHYKTVEVDQWFWSLFGKDKVVLPKPDVVQEYADSVPNDFKFGVKVPNSITLTHHYKKTKPDKLVKNKHFLSADLFSKFLDLLKPLRQNLGPIMFQFEYLNRQKMPGALNQFIDLFGAFSEKITDGLNICVEIRNPNYLNDEYFTFLKDQGLHHVFLQGYYMPSIFKIYSKFKDLIEKSIVIRLHGPDRKKIEKLTGKDWSQIVSSRDDDISALTAMLVDLKRRDVESFIFVNNHFEGSAPRTIERIYRNTLKRVK